MQNTLTIAELKRRGMAALEEALTHGPVHILKRNKPSAVVLSEAEYQHLTAGRPADVPGLTAVQWLLDQPTVGTNRKEDLDARLAADREW
mgnify:CR=1 FL=1